MSETTFYFNKQNSIGAKGEDYFVNCYEGAEKTDGRKFDLKYNGDSVELKTDTYSINKTENFFMERYGNCEQKSDGGPWRAKKDGVKYFVYLYSNDNVFYWFDTNLLVDELENIIAKEKPKQRFVNNKNYKTMGFAIKRNFLINSVIRVDKF